MWQHLINGGNGQQGRRSSSNPRKTFTMEGTMPSLPIGPIASAPECRPPSKRSHVGRSVKLMPMTKSHAHELWRAAQKADESWTYLGYGPFGSFEDFEAHVARLEGLIDQPFFSVLPFNGNVSGWISFCDIDTDNAALEIGSIWFSPEMQRTRSATEAIYLLIDHAFSIGFNRVAWRCNALNMPSRNAALRLGFSFEGIWRQAQIIKGRWRDTAWYAQVSEEWPANKLLIERWLADDNFDANGRQYTSLR